MGTQKKLMQVSFSGGRTSAYMGKRLLDEKSDEYDFIFTFANTGREHPKTLEFIHNCDKYFGFNTVWMEAVIHHGIRKGPTHQIVTFETASRNGGPFEEAIRKHGIPNISQPNCTARLKVEPMESYLRSLGIKPRDIPTAIGIRVDEKRRVSAKAGVNNIIYPLVDWFPVDKQDVLDWWEDQPFNLEIEEFEGNCLGCYKKSLNKHFLQIQKDPSVYDFTREMEQRYSTHKVSYGRRVFFRGDRSTDDLFALYNEVKNPGHVIRIDPYTDGGCSESCEVYPTEIEA